MGGSSKPRSHLHHEVRAERAVKRYRIRLDGRRQDFSERTRLALAGFASRFGREDDDTLYAGALARIVGDGNGWTAATTIRSFMARGWIVEAPDKRSDLSPWVVHYRITDDGLKVLRQLDAEWPLERCPACAGESPLRHRDREFSRLAEGTCTTCAGSRLRLRAPEEG